MAQNLKDLYSSGVEAVVTPFPIPIDGAKVKGLPFYSYRDLNGT